MSVWATRARYRIDNKMCLFTNPSNYIEWTRTITLEISDQDYEVLASTSYDGSTSSKMIYVPGVPALCLRDTPVRCMVVWSPLSCAERPVTADTADRCPCP